MFTFNQFCLCSLNCAELVSILSGMVKYLQFPITFFLLNVHIEKSNIYMKRYLWMFGRFSVKNGCGRIMYWNILEK